MQQFILIIIAIITFCSISFAQTHKPDFIQNGIEFTKLSDTVWMHSSYKDMGKWGMVLTNGLIVLGEEATTLIDTAWDDKQTETVLDWSANYLKRPITQAIFTHAHQDKMGGVGLVKKHHIKTWAHPLSNIIAPKKDLVPAEFNLTFDQNGKSVDLAPLQVVYPGPGHTIDNIVVNIPDMDILFGGCLIRPGDSDNLGYTKEGDINAWGTSVEKVLMNFPNTKIVVPSHSAPGDKKLLLHTINLAKAKVAAQ